MEISLEKIVHAIVCAYLDLDDEDHENDDEAAPMEAELLTIFRKYGAPKRGSGESRKEAK